MIKINHAERVRGEARDREFYDNLVDRAGGAQAAEAIFSECVDQLHARGLAESEASEILLRYAAALQDNGFNAGFEHGFAEGAMLSAYGNFKSKKYGG